MPNILSAVIDERTEGEASMINNPHKLSREEVMELADLMMQLWLQLKENIRKNGIDSPKIFSRDNSK